MKICIAGQKGGTGKSTIAVAIAAEWHCRGLRVLLVDADPQGSARTWSAVAAEAGYPTPTVVGMGVGLHRPDQLPALATGYDVVVVDCPPRHDSIGRSALMVSDLAVLPCGPSAMDAWALGETATLVQEAQVLRPGLVAGVVITRKVARTAIGQGAREVLSGSGLPVFVTELGHRVAYQEAPAAGLGVTQYAPTSSAAAEVCALVAEIETVLGLNKEAAHAVA